MKRRWKILIVAGIIAVLLAASLSLTLHLQPENELEACKKILRAKGEKLQLSEVLPPPAAPEDNSATAVQDAFRMLGLGDLNVPYGMTMVAPGKALIGWQQPDARGTGFTNSWEDFAAGVEANRPALELLHEVLERPRLDFQLDYQQGAKLLLPHLAPMKRSALMLDAAAIFQLHRGNCDAAVTNILVTLALVQKDSADSFRISHLVRIAMAAVAVAPTWELLQATNITDAQLAAVQNGWQQLRFLQDAEDTFTVERAWLSVEIQKSRASHDGFKETMGAMSGGGSGGPSSSSSSWDWPALIEDVTKGPRLAAAETMWRSSWSYSKEMDLLKSGQIVLEALRTMQTNQAQFYKTNYDAMVARLGLLESTNTGAALFRALSVPNLGDQLGGRYFFGSSLRRTLQMETARRVVITAIALKRFALKHGRWPDSLDALAPDFVPAVPIDPFDGKPLKYRPNADGTFLLYSVGEDGTDEGGEATGPSNWNWLRARDWVWPQPATPAEIQDFYEHPSK